MIRSRIAQPATALRQRWSAAASLVLFLLVQLGGWAHLGHVEHEVCEAHGDLCHVEEAGSADTPAEPTREPAAPAEGEDPEDDHRCAWQELYRERALVPNELALAARELSSCASVEPFPTTRPAYRERLYLLAPKGSPPRA